MLKERLIDQIARARYAMRGEATIFDALNETRVLLEIFIQYIEEMTNEEVVD
jgi:hypothetical protein